MKTGVTQSVWFGSYCCTTTVCNTWMPLVRCAMTSRVKNMHTRASLNSFNSCPMLRKCSWNLFRSAWSPCVFTPGDIALVTPTTSGTRHGDFWSFVMSSWWWWWLKGWWGGLETNQCGDRSGWHTLWCADNFTVRSSGSVSLFEMKDYHYCRKTSARVRGIWRGQTIDNGRHPN